MTRTNEVLRLLYDANVKGYRLTSVDIQKGFDVPLSTITSCLNKLWKWGYVHRVKNERPYRYEISEYGIKKLRRLYGF